MHGTLEHLTWIGDSKPVTFSSQLSAFNHLTTIHFNKNFNYVHLHQVLHSLLLRFPGIYR